MGTRSKKNKRVEITPRKLEEIKVDASVQTQLVIFAYLMDEWDYDRDKLVDLWNGVGRYADAIKTKLISIQKVCDIINENVPGLDIRWNGR